jgi:hypothetical protein
MPASAAVASRYETAAKVTNNVASLIDAIRMAALPSCE